MRCYKCNVKMKYSFSINAGKLRVNMFSCENCKSSANVKYSMDGKYIESVVWEVKI